jgi:hypothetical protein
MVQVHVGTMNFVNNNDMKKPQEDIHEELINEGLSEGNRFKELSKFKRKRNCSRGINE